MCQCHQGMTRDPSLYIASWVSPGLCSQVCWPTLTRFMKGWGAHSWNLVKSPLAVIIMILMIKSGHNFAHVMTAELSWYTCMCKIMTWSHHYFSSKHKNVFFQIGLWAHEPFAGLDSRFVPSQWKTLLQSNTLSHWLGTNLESALLCKVVPRDQAGVGCIFVIDCKKGRDSCILVHNLEFQLVMLNLIFQF